MFIKRFSYLLMSLMLSSTTFAVTYDIEPTQALDDHSAKSVEKTSEIEVQISETVKSEVRLLSIYSPESNYPYRYYLVVSNPASQEDLGEGEKATHVYLMGHGLLKTELDSAKVIEVDGNKILSAEFKRLRRRTREELKDAVYDRISIKLTIGAENTIGSKGKRTVEEIR